jgi:ribosomal protein S18 acetylase RimI-like enzyme
MINKKMSESLDKAKNEYAIVPLTAANARHLPLPQEPIDVIGRIVPVYDGSRWTSSERLYDTPTTKTYPTEQFDVGSYIGNPKQAGCLAMLGDECVGVIRFSDRWQKNAFIDDLAINRAHRGKGLGTRLMDEAVAWGRANGYWGVSLETQGWNLLAVRFYFKYGFKIGGVDDSVYKALPEPYANDTALYLYMLPEE